MHVSEVHDYGDTTEHPPAKEFLSQGRQKKIKDAIGDIFDDEANAFEEYANEYIGNLASTRAERFLERVLNGDDDAAMALLGSRDNGDRYKKCGYDDGKPWASLIHGSLFETGGIKLRRQIVEAHPELIRNERIADLESEVDGLTQQVRKLEADLERAYERIT